MEARRDLREGLVVPGTEILETLYLNGDSTHPSVAILNLDPVTWMAYGAKTRTRNIASTFMSVRINHIRAEWVPAASTLASGSVYMGFFRHDDMEVTPSGVMAAESHVSGSVWSRHDVVMSSNYLPSRDYIFRQKELGNFPVLVALVEAGTSGQPSVAGKIVIHYNFSWSAPAVEPINFDKVTVPISQSNSIAVLNRGVPLEGFVMQNPTSAALMTVMRKSGSVWSAIFQKLIQLGKAVYASLQPDSLLKLVIDGVSALVSQTTVETGLLSEGDDPMVQYILDADAVQTGEPVSQETQCSDVVSYLNEAGSIITAPVYDLKQSLTFTPVTATSGYNGTKAVIASVNMKRLRCECSSTGDSWTEITTAFTAVYVPALTTLVFKVKPECLQAWGLPSFSERETISILLPYSSSPRQLIGWASGGTASTNIVNMSETTLVSRSMLNSSSAPGKEIYEANPLVYTGIVPNLHVTISGAVIYAPGTFYRTSISTNLKLVNFCQMPQMASYVSNTYTADIIPNPAMFYDYGTGSNVLHTNVPYAGTSSTNSAPSADGPVTYSGYRPIVIMGLQASDVQNILQERLVAQGVPEAYFA